MQPALASVPLAALPTPVWVALVAAAASVVTTLATVAAAGWVEGMKLRTQHRHEQRRELRKLISRYHGRMLEAAVDWDRRMNQLYKGEETQKHLRVPPEKYGDRTQYLFRSYVFRFLSLCAIARKFEGEAFYIDARIARSRDFEFLKFAKAFLWAMTYADLTPQDGMPGRDHFANDQFRPLLDLCYRKDEPGLPATLTREDEELVFDFRRFDAIAERVHRLADPSRATGPDGRPGGPDVSPGDQPWQDMHKVFEFFSHLHEDSPLSTNHRYRWERLVVLHLLTIGFINAFGYPWQRVSDAEIERVVGKLRFACVADSLHRTIPQLGLAARHAGEPRRTGPLRQICTAARERADRPACELCGRSVARGEPFPRPCDGPPPESPAETTVVAVATAIG